VQDTKFESVNNISELLGTLQSVEEKISGTVNSVNVHEGSQVNVNDILTNIDSKKYELQVAQAQVNVDKASAALTQTEKGARVKQIEQAKLKADQAETSYNQVVTDYNRNKTLFEARAIAQSDYEKYQNAMTSAQKDLETVNQAYSLTVGRGKKAGKRSL
jgi:multidrug resistance efflux pump